MVVLEALAVTAGTALLLAAAASHHLAQVGRGAGLVVPLVADRGRPRPAGRRHLVALPTPPPSEHGHSRAA